MPPPPPLAYGAYASPPTGIFGQMNCGGRRPNKKMRALNWKKLPINKVSSESC